MTGLDIFWPSDESLEASGNLPIRTCLPRESSKTSKPPSNNSGRSPRILVQILPKANKRAIEPVILARCLLILGILIVITSGCATRAYEGVPHPSTEIAVVHDDARFYGFVNRNVHVVSVDGEKLSKRGFKLELLPGVHVLGVIFLDVRFGLARTAKSPCWITFYAEAGREYRIASETTGELWQIWLVDQQTGRQTECLYGQPGGHHHDRLACYAQ